MSAAKFKETKDSDWTVLVNAIQKASLAENVYHENLSRPVISYEEFCEELKRSNVNVHNTVETSSKLDDENNNTTIGEEKGGADDELYVLGDWKSDDDDVKVGDNGESSDSGKNDINAKAKKIKLRKNKSARRFYTGKLQPHARKLKYLLDYSSSSTSEDENKNGESKTKQDDDLTHTYSPEENFSWESLSSSTDDNNEYQSFDDFSEATAKCKKRRQKAANNDNDDLSNFMRPYTRLSECLLRYYNPTQVSGRGCQQPSTNSKARKKKQFDCDEEFTRNGQDPLEERIPLMQVIDTLEDINKVLKVGKITPRMERILEYKQSYPYAEGYEEEQWGWCPWLVYKIERFCKRLRTKQWPYH